ncbi:MULTISPECIES: T6SS immunity protein Tdi1 domain-containing protein [unclassified Variovorax]|jgi:hypothetical protein|uniref:T6SS immunity protein Tdi1 domain-containing protein n=1 Tax=unclassified Variovorax TaxID=663243 RepID=UPI0008BE470A|nr:MULTISPECIES: T6SS immunity protein Tdi1 domain-containing protein [unclassified Variovorax]SEK16809.1 protein of unknown function [Variovorax sp. OK202]SFE59953.1 protein of unknown function [Variovorax sp. OK212]
MTLDDLTVNFQHLQREKVLEDWAWLLGGDAVPILITAVGNAFVEDPSTGEVKLLDVGSPDVVPVAASASEFQDLLTQREFVLRFFDASLMVELLNTGQPLKAGQVFGFKRLPSLGGYYIVDNFEPTDIEVHFAVCGQLQAQTSHLAPGTEIRSVSIRDDGR